jgi:hypothetical protein
MMVKIALKDKLDKLIALMLVNGVQPGDLADNIFLDSYNSIIYKKEKDMVIGELNYLEDHGSIILDVTLRYYYDSERNIIKIEETLLNQTKLLWDRNTKETELLTDIIVAMKEDYSDKQIDKFISSLPHGLQDLLKTAFINVA